MKKNKTLTLCPICDHDLTITKLACSSCQTVIEGNFIFSKFNYLDEDKLYFIEIFMKNRGNIKLIEKELNVSYPTVKKMLDETIVALGYKVDNEEESNAVSLDVLEQIKSGEITVDEAVRKLKKKE